MKTDQKLLDEIVGCGITHIVWLPDSEAGFMYQSMAKRPELTLVPVCREGEAIAVAAGLIVGGRKAMVLHQSTGFYESGDSLRGVALNLRLPLLLMLGYKGWLKDAPLTDSSAIFLEPVLKAWGIEHFMLESDEDRKNISIAYNLAAKKQMPVALLLTPQRAAS
ncbi:MAG: hypothetical protein HYX90_02535 [Chloroflexi bacterium]|nr:hypothetical protein [Chloroflexota bacterium]